MQLEETFKRVKRASKTLALLTDAQRNEILLAVADAIVNNKERILGANAEDLAKMDKTNPLYDRLQLTEKRLDDIAGDMRNVATLPSPLGHVTKQKTLANGLRLCRVSVPFGVIGMIYEARPNVTYDVFSLCFKSGNACVLKGGRDAVASNEEGVALIHEVLAQFGVNPDVVTLLPATHEATGEMLNAVGYVDLCIPVVAANSSTSCVTQPGFLSSRQVLAWFIFTLTKTETSIKDALLSTTQRHDECQSVTHSIRCSSTRTGRQTLLLCWLRWRERLSFSSTMRDTTIRSSWTIR